LVVVLLEADVPVVGVDTGALWADVSASLPSPLVSPCLFPDVPF
jgi:hypothetical protein